MDIEDYERGKVENGEEQKFIESKKASLRYSSDYPKKDLRHKE